MIDDGIVFIETLKVEENAAVEIKARCDIEFTSHDTNRGLERLMPV